jgi:hypothetical protein
VRLAPTISVVLALLALGGAAGATPVLQSASDPHPGVHKELWLDATIPAKLHLVRIDLTSAEIALYATKQADRGQTVSAYASKLAAQVAINGDSFSAAGYQPTGLAIGESMVWSGTADDTISAVLHLRRVGERTMMGIVPPELVTTPDMLPPGTQGAISGRPLLVRAGVVESQFDCNDQTTLACERAPRSAAALSATRCGWSSSTAGRPDRSA